MVATISLVGFVADQMWCSISVIGLLYNIIINEYILVFIYIK